MKFNFKLNESTGPITFENLDKYKDTLFVGNNVTYNGRKKYYKLVGKFVGYDGREYVAIVTANGFHDKNYLRFPNFIKNYSIYQPEKY